MHSNAQQQISAAERVRSAPRSSMRAVKLADQPVSLLLIHTLKIFIIAAHSSFVIYCLIQYLGKLVQLFSFSSSLLMIERRVQSKAGRHRHPRWRERVKEIKTSLCREIDSYLSIKMNCHLPFVRLEIYLHNNHSLMRTNWKQNDDDDLRPRLIGY